MGTLFKILLMMGLVVYDSHSYCERVQYKQDIILYEVLTLDDNCFIESSVNLGELYHIYSQY